MTHLMGVWFTVTGPEVASGRTSDMHTVDRERPHAPAGIAEISTGRRAATTVVGRAALGRQYQTDNCTANVLDRMTSPGAVLLKAA